MPKIIDFGVAKVLTVPLREQTLFTQQGQLLVLQRYKGFVLIHKLFVIRDLRSPAMRLLSHI